jgi:RimJ/RimL family protein N-acetyltransferase
MADTPAPAQPYFLQTDRLGFREWREGDLPLALGLWGDPEVTRLIDGRGALTERQVRERLELEIANGQAYGVQYWPIFLRAGGAHVGCCGLRPRDVPAGVYELGVHIRTGHWHQGFAMEAASAVVKYAFGTLGARALFAGHNPNNQRSRRLLERLGFRHTHDEFYPPTGLQHPSYILESPGGRMAGP